MKLLIIFLTVMMCMAGCKKVLTLEPENSLTFGNGIKTQKDIEALIAGAGKLTLDFTANYNGQLSKGAYADVVRQFGGRNGNPQRELSPDAIMYGQWFQEYKVIAQANEILKFIKRIEMTEDQKKLYRGQALFYKAFSYLNLIRRYGDCILIRDNINMEPQAKSPWPEVADYAIELATEATNILPEFDKVRLHNGNPATSRSTPCKGSAAAVLANLCAWKAGGKYFAADNDYDEQALWQKAEEACTIIINSSNYQLAANPEEVCTKVLDGGSSESVYEDVYKNMWHEVPSNDKEKDFLLARYYQDWPVLPNSSPYNIENLNFRIYNTTVLEMFPGNDLRKYAYFYDFDEMSKPENFPISKGYAYPYKWRNIIVATEGWQAGQMLNYNVNKVWWRLAEVILLRAECRARLGDNSGAITDLNTVRMRAQADLYNVSEHNGDLRYTIFKEREKESIMEDYRYFDVIRNEYARTELNGGFKTASNQDFIDGAFFQILYPDEFRNNPLLRQNKYWSKFL